MKEYTQFRFVKFPFFISTWNSFASVNIPMRDSTISSECWKAIV